MKLRAAALAILALAIAPTAAAQAACDAYRKLADEQLKGFSSIVSGDGRFFRDTSLHIPGAGECSIMNSSTGLNYSCSLEFDTEEKAREAAAAKVVEIRSCLAGWLQRTRTSLPRSFDPSFKMLSQVGFLRPDASEEDPLIVQTSRMEEDGKVFYFADVSMDWRRVKPSQLLDISEKGFCSTINRIIAASADRFASFQGAARPAKKQTFDAKFSLSEEVDCIVDLSAGAAYQCIGRIGFLDGGEMLHDKRSDQMKACLTDWKQDVLPESKLEGRDRRLAGLRFTGAGANAGVEVILYLDKRELPKNDVAFDNTTIVRRR